LPTLRKGELLKLGFIRGKERVERKRKRSKKFGLFSLRSRNTPPFEAGFEKDFDYTIAVIADDRIRQKRYAESSIDFSKRDEYK